MTAVRMHQMLDQVLQGQTGALAENLGGIDEHRTLAAGTTTTATFLILLLWNPACCFGPSLKTL